MLSGRDYHTGLSYRPSIIRNSTNTETQLQAKAYGVGVRGEEWDTKTKAAVPAL